MHMSLRIFPNLLVYAGCAHVTCLSTCAHAGLLEFCICICAASKKLINICRVKQCLLPFCLPKLNIVFVRTTHMLGVILRHCFKSGCFAPLFLPGIKNRNIHALWMYFPSRKCGVLGAWHWLRIITWPPLSDHYWLAPVVHCEEKLFWQDPGAQRSCWKLGEGHCQWNQESSGGLESWHHQGCELRGAGIRPPSYSKWSNGWRTVEENERGTGEDNDAEQRHTEHVSWSQA